MAGMIQTMMTNYKTAGTVPFVAPTYTTDSACLLYYDPANPLCYSGTGTTLNNLSAGGLAGTSATVVNATYNSSLNSGVFTFVGTAGNQYIMTPNLSSFYGASFKDITIEMWIYGTANGSALMEVGQNSISTGWRNNVMELGTIGPFFGPRAGYLSTSDTMISNSANGTPGLNRWMHFALTTYGGSSGNLIGPNLYYNGLAGTTGNKGVRKFPQEQSPLLTGQTSNYFGWAFGAGSTQNTLNLSGGSSMFTGRLGIIRVYNAVLSQAQIQSNFNAVKSRYGL
jgi:hypothetical protein